MSAKLFYRLIDAAAEKVYRTATVLGPAVGGAVFERMAVASSSAGDTSREGYFLDGTPHPENVADENWRSFYQDRI